MTISSLLINFNQFGWAEWCVLGVFGVIAVFAFIKGYKKGFINLKLRTLSWAFGCALFLGLEIFFHDKCFVNDLLKTASLKFKHDAIASFVSTGTWLVIALLVRWAVFGSIYVVSSQYKAKMLKKAAKIALREKETGEEYLPDENKVYKPLPIDGVVKSGPLGRLFGGVCQALTALSVAAVAVAIAVVVVRLTPFYQYIMPHNNGGLSTVWQLMKSYALDIVLMTISSALIIKGYKDGILNGINTVGVTIVKVVAILGAMYLPFSIWTAPGGMFEFLTIGAENLSAKITFPLPVVVKVAAVKACFSVVLAIVAWILVKMIGKGCDKLLDYVDDNPALWRVDGVIGAMIYFIIMLGIMAVITFMMYSIEFFGTFPMSQLFTENSSLAGGAFRVFDVTIKPILEQVKTLFTVRTM